MWETKLYSMVASLVVFSSLPGTCTSLSLNEDSAFTVRYGMVRYGMRA